MTDMMETELNMTNVMETEIALPEIAEPVTPIDPVILVDKAPFILASVGTDHHPFDRFVSWLDAWQEQNVECELFIQRGTTALVPHAQSSEWLERSELNNMMQRADAIVCHGGPSTIMEARKAGVVPVVIPRDPSLGEHVDEHQMRFAEFMDRKGAIRLVRSPAELAEHLDCLMQGGTQRVVTGTPPETLERISSVVEDTMRRPALPFWKRLGGR